jgi:hypothetical protein
MQRFGVAGLDVAAEIEVFLAYTGKEDGPDDEK